MLDQLIPVLGDINFSLIIKGVVLFILLGYVVFTFMIFVQIRALNRTVQISAMKASSLVFFFALSYLLLSISLFIAALVIL